MLGSRACANPAFPMTTLQSLSQAVISGNSKNAKALTLQALDEGIAPVTLVDQALVPAMAQVGDKFKNNEIFVPEMLIAARAMKAGLAALEPLMLASNSGYERKFAGKVMIGTVEGDLHDIGKNLVIVMWQGAGFEVIDLGIDVKAAAFVEAIEKHQPQVVGIAALLTTTMRAMGETIKVIANAGLRDKVKIIVGGAPVTQAFADEIGADAYASDAGAAVDLVKKLTA
jgi:5-methyltetrahydrofolate--homocysteine methyltransferase